MGKYVLSLIIAALCSFNIIGYLNAFNNIMSNEQALQIISQETPNQEIKMTPEYLYKIVSQREWQESLLQNEVVASPMDKEFFHLAKEDQVNQIVQKFWKNMDYIVLTLDSKKLLGRLTYETNPEGTLFTTIFTKDVSLLRQLWTSL